MEESPHPIYEFLFGFEEEGYVYYPIWHRDYFFFIVGFALLLLLLLVVLLVVNARDKKKLAMQHALLKEANAQVTASIQYASRIQQALLTDVDQAKALLPDFGLLFKPRDIVSGDFYWISEVEDKIFVLGMDCTGHGVPGAFLTLLAFQEVRQIVFERRLQAPGEVLFALHQQFLVHMKASKSEQSDGAEVALCVLDKKGKKLTYSGAKMDLYHNRAGQISKVKASNCWIGCNMLQGNENPFFDTSIDYEAGDQFYLFSDGLPDQFGGPNNKKFLRKQLLKILDENHFKKPHEVVAVLEKRFFEWKGTYRQIDDVLVLGFEV